MSGLVRLDCGSSGPQPADGAGAGLRDEPLSAEGPAFEQRERRPGRVGGAAIDRWAGGRYTPGKGRTEARQEIPLR